MSNARNKSLFQVVVITIILILINFLGSFFYSHLDLTEDGRFSLTPATKNQIGNLDDILYVEVFLDGEFPAGFTRLRNSVQDLLDDFRSLNSNVEYQFVNPLLGTAEENKATQEALKKRGIYPVNLTVKDDAAQSEKLIYPVAFLRYKGRERLVRLLENQTPGTPQQVVLNNSVSLLEYKFTNAVKKMQTVSKHKIAFTEGHGELYPHESADFENSLSEFYDVAKLNLDSITIIDQQISLLVVARPRGQFPEKQKFIIDQYVMNGGRILWLIDRLGMGMDSLKVAPEYMPVEYPLNLDDLFFKYGFRIQPNLVLDLQCSKIPLPIGMVGNQPQYDMRGWYYNPIIVPGLENDHPIVNNLDGIDFSFASSIDTIRTKTPVKKTVLLKTSPYSRAQFAPMRISLEILRYPPEKDKFNKPDQPVAVLLEGQFPSLFENRVSDEMNAGLKQLDQEFKAKSSKTKMIIVSDGDVARNYVNLAKKELKPLGYNQYERYTFANKDFLMNAVEYLIENDGLIASRAKEVKLRMLNKQKAQEEKLFWQLINIGLPLLLLGLFGFVYFWFRKRRYAKG